MTHDHGPQPGESNTDPVKVYDWLGVPFAMLQAPAWRRYWVGYYSETTHADVFGVTRDLGVERHIQVSVAHELDDTTTVNVTTRRDDSGGASAMHFLWETLIDYRLALVGRAGGPPWGTAPPPPEMIDQFDANNPPEPTGTRPVTIDGVPHEWHYLTSTDLATGQPLLACAGHLGTSLIALTGPDSVIKAATLTMHPPAAPPSRR